MAGPHFELERDAIGSGAHFVAGVDEVGRGPLAGPVTAAAVILDRAQIPEGLADSKALSATKRALLHDAILSSAMVGIGHASVEEIDTINVLQATFLAMRRAMAALSRQPDMALIDGNRLPDDLPCPAQAVVKGDATCLSIAAASIVAKVTRDRIMWDLAQHYPGYGWETNAGYGSKSHILALKKLGPTPHHRRSFRPVHNILYQEFS
jgi:ribonuclease HII